MRVDDEFHRAVARNEVGELLDRTRLHVHPRSREQDPVDVLRLRVGDLLVDRERSRWSS